MLTTKSKIEIARKDTCVSNQNSKTVTDFSIDSIGEPISCDIVLSKNVSNQREYNVLSITECKDTVAYVDDNGFYSYRTTTHKLSDDTNLDYRIACLSDGTVELYSNSIGAEYWHYICSYKVGSHIVDPIIAFATPGFVYVVVNKPTKATIKLGKVNRKPVFSKEDGLVCSAGSPRIIKFDIMSGKSQQILEPNIALPEYITGIIDDPDSNELPEIIFVNLNTQKQDASNITSFKKFLIKHIIDSNNFNNKKTTENTNIIPPGVSVVKLNGDKTKKTVQIDQSNLLEYGIAKVRFYQDDEKDYSSVNLCTE